MLQLLCAEAADRLLDLRLVGASRPLRRSALAQLNHGLEQKGQSR